MIHFFTTEQGNLLIRFLLAHIAADFILQTSSMVAQKKWLAKEMLLHITILFLLAGLMTGLWLPALVIAGLHWVIDSMKATYVKRNAEREGRAFVVDQFFHVLVLGLVWCWQEDLCAAVYQAILFPFTDYKASVLLLGYAFVIWPLGYLLRYALKKLGLNSIKPENPTIVVNAQSPVFREEATKNAENAKKIERGGFLIGQFERIIILSFVLLGQYEAIGFLITGKGIIRFAQKDENVRSEYVLVGTMMSYAVSILTGVLMNWLLRVAI